jgi:transposase
MSKRRSFDRAYKLSAVRLLAASDDSVSQVARSLGIHDNLLRRWREQFGDGRTSAVQESLRHERAEVVRLQRRCRDLERELTLLKKTLGLSDRRCRRATP